MGNNLSVGSTSTTTMPPAAPAPAAPPPAHPNGGSLVGFVKDVFVGGGEAALGMVEGIGTMICHPIKTVEGLGYGITHPAALYHAFVDPFSQAIASGHPGEALGMGIVDIGTFFIPGAGVFGGGANAAAKAADAAAIASKAADVAATAGKAADVAVTAGKAADVAVTAGKAADVAVTAGKAADVAATASKAAELASIAGKASDGFKAAQEALAAAQASGDSAKIAEATSAASKAAQALKDANTAAQAASSAAKLAARLAEKPVMTKAAAAALADAKISAKVGKAALAGAHQAYWEARAAGQSVEAARAAAAAKAAQITGLAKDSAAVTKIVEGARLAGAATNTAKWIGRTDYLERPLVGAAKTVGGAADQGISVVGKAGAYVAKTARVIPGEVSSAASKLGSITLKDIVTAPIRIPLVALRDVKNILGAAVAAAKARVAAVGADASKAVGQAAQDAGKVAEDVGNTQLKDIPAAGMRAVALAGPGAGQVAQILAGALKAPIALAKQVGRFAITHPQWVAAAGLSGEIGAGAPAIASGAGTPGSLSDGQVQQLAGQYGLLPTAANVQAFVKEVQGYAGNAIGPDSTNADPIKQVQTVLASLGYAVNPSGKWDDSTANAVVDFKKQHGITQTYQLADGTRAVNEYVDESTANAMVAALQGGWKAGQGASSASSSTSPTPASTSSTSSASSTAPASPASPAPPASGPLSDSDVAALAGQHNLEPDRANVEAFVTEISSYQANGLGPDAGDAQGITSLQQALALLGYSGVNATGKWDDATTKAVIDFKQKHALHQTYKAANGAWAVNEYVDETTAAAIASALPPAQAGQ